MDKKIRLVYGLPSLGIGGIERQLVKQLGLFDQKKYDIYLITLFKYKDKANLFEDLPEWIKVHKFSFSGIFDLKNILKLFKLLKNIKPDLVVSSMVSANTIFRVLKIFLGYKVVAREHNIYLDKVWRHRFFDKFLSKLSDGLVAVSHSVAEHASKQAGININRFTIIHNGVDIDSIKNYQAKAEQKIIDLRNEFKLNDNIKIILNVARLKPQKNHKLLIDAFELFWQENKDYVLFILGDGIDKEELEDYVKNKNLDKYIFIPGYRKDVYTFYAAAQFFVLSSRFEGFPNVGVEAMAFGLPMISTKVPGVDEFLKDEHNGYVVESQPDKMAAKMLLVASQDKEKYKQNCIATADNYSITKCVANYQKLFDKVLKDDDYE